MENNNLAKNNHWLYRGNIITEKDISQDQLGFIYIITQKSTGKKYIGRKMLWKTKTRTIKGKKKKEIVSSDWLTYWSSSPYLLDMIEEYGKDDFSREILIFCYSKSEILYAEEAILYHVNAMLDDSWLNGNIRTKIQKSWFSKTGKDVLNRMEEMRKILVVT